MFQPHLVIRRLDLPPEAEWRPESQGWLFVLVTSGEVYCSHAAMNEHVPTWAVIIFPDAERSSVKAALTTGATLHHFLVEPEGLLGLITLKEQRSLVRMSLGEKHPPRVLPPEHSISERFRKICADSIGNQFRSRIELLKIFGDSLGEEMDTCSRETVSTGLARTRVEEFLRELPPLGLVDLRLDQLVERVGCSPRHVSRLFHEVTGASFRTKQVEARLSRARELLATSDRKVMSVACESGFPSVSLFHLIFKRRFGTTPTDWRERIRKKKKKWRISRNQLLKD